MLARYSESTWNLAFHQIWCNSKLYPKIPCGDLEWARNDLHLSAVGETVEITLIVLLIPIKAGRGDMDENV